MFIPNEYILIIGPFSNKYKMTHNLVLFTTFKRQILHTLHVINITNKQIATHANSPDLWVNIHAQSTKKHLLLSILYPVKG